MRSTLSVARIDCVISRFIHYSRMKHHILLLMIISNKLSDCNIHDKMTELFSVLYCIGTSSVDCASEPCSSFYEYLTDEKYCRSTGAVDWSTTMALSLTPFADFGSLYRLGINFEGVFELVHIIFAIISLLMKIEVEKHEHRDCTVFGGWIIVIFVILDLAKILVDYKTATTTEIVVQIIFVILSFII